MNVPLTTAGIIVEHVDGDRPKPSLELIEGIIYDNITEGGRISLCLTDLSEVLCIYLFGSRLHQCWTAESDYDLMVVVGGPYFLGCKVWHDEVLNINAYHVQHFQGLSPLHCSDTVSWKSSI